MKLSCVACRQKKVKCDRGDPCKNCLKAGTHCVPQTRAKVTRRLKKPADTQVLERLKQLESIVSRLEGDGSNVSQSPPAQSPPLNQTVPISTPSIADTVGHDKLNGRLQSPLPPTTEGRLVVKDGKTTYVTGGFWANLTNEIVDLIELTDSPDDEDDRDDDAEAETPEDQSMSPEEMASTLSPSFVLGFTSDSLTLRMMHPTPDHIMSIWQVYKERIAPINRSVHAPTVEKLVLEAVQDIRSLNHATEALMFSIYYLSTLTLTQDETVSRYGLERRKTLDRYRFATEQALARAGFLLSQDIVLLQSFHLYISALSRDIDDSSVPKLVVLMVNIAESMGLHRDGEKFGLPPFEIELRRRVWWTCRTLDMRASLDHDSQSMTADRWSDTKLPLNVDDEDIWPGMTHQPQPRVEFTPMTFSLVRWELAATFLRFGKISNSSGILEISQVQAHEEMLDEVQQRLEDRYLSPYKNVNYDEHPMQWSSVMLTDIMIARLWLVIYHPLIRKCFQTGTNPELREKAFNKALDAIRKNRELEINVEGTPHAWLLKPILHWHAMVIVLCVLCERQKEYDDVWAVVEEAIGAWSKNHLYTRSKLWKPLCRLYERAQRTRLIETPKLARASFGSEDQPPYPTDTETLMSYDFGDSMYQLPTSFTNTAFGQPGSTAPLDITQGFDMPMDDIMLPPDPLMADGAPWDWSTWDAIYREGT